jgi:hypothetical protein
LAKLVRTRHQIQAMPLGGANSPDNCAITGAFVIIDHISHACVAHARGAKPIAVKHLEQFDSQRCQSSVLVQKRIGKPAMRKYKLPNSVNCSLYTWCRSITTRRPRRTASEIELIFRESTNLAAASLRASGMNRSAELVQLSPIGIGDFLFDPVAFRGCVNLAR